MWVEEYDEAQVMELFWEEGRKEGREEGHAEGVIDTLRALVDDGLITTRVAAGQLGVSEADFLAMSSERAPASQTCGNPGRIGSRQGGTASSATRQRSLTSSESERRPRRHSRR